MSQPVFFAALKANGIPLPETEVRFAPPRRWRFDYAWISQRVALEVEGGVWTGGRHTRGSGFLKDMAKYNEASAHGWRVIRCTPSTLATMDTVTLVASTLGIALAA